jgi:hypothetical protein
VVSLVAPRVLGFAFLASLIMMPVLMTFSIGLQVRDTASSFLGSRPSPLKP